MNVLQFFNPSHSKDSAYLLQEAAGYLCHLYTSAEMEAEEHGRSVTTSDVVSEHPASHLGASAAGHSVFLQPRRSWR